MHDESGESILSSRKSCAQVLSTAEIKIRGHSKHCGVPIRYV